MQTDPLLLPILEAMLLAETTAAPPTWQNPDQTCHVFQHVISINGQDVNCIAFAGTQTLKEWLVDDFNPLETPVEFSAQVGPVHQPSLNNVRAVMPHIIARLEDLGGPPYYLAGHSKGAREAAIAAALLTACGLPPLATRLFECPRPGGAQLASYLSGSDISATRTWNAQGIDPVTLLPSGPGWADPCRLIDIRVPDSFGLVAKHLVSGVITGLENLS